MQNIFKLNTHDQDILEHLAEMVNFAKDELTKHTIYKYKLTPKQTLVVSMFAAINTYTEAIFELCKQGRPEPSIVILRSIIEAYINSNFVLGHSNNKLLWIFAIEDSYYRKSMIEEVDKYYKTYPKMRSKILSRAKVREMKAIPIQELNDYKANLRISFQNKDQFDKIWGSLLERGKRIDRRLVKRQKDRAGNIEHLYLFVYKYFSEYTHLQMRGIQHFWMTTKEGDTLIIDRNPDNQTHVLVMAYIMYLYFTSRLRQYKLINCSLSKFITYSKKLTI